MEVRDSLNKVKFPPLVEVDYSFKIGGMGRKNLGEEIIL
jgi:hypothetical protein